MPAPDEVRYLLPDDARELMPARKPRRSAAENWWIASYSALRVGDQTLGADSSQAQQLMDDERVDAQQLREIPAESGDIHRFPVAQAQAPSSMGCWSGLGAKALPKSAPTPN